ncbi:MAG: WYL domain-containing protein [Ruminococcus sp.]|nr:WYL domain-containing protein [Ruminococcus sp.]
MEHERILYILDYLTRCTDEKHGASLQEIKRYLESETNMESVSILTIRRDIERLECAGNDVRFHTAAHNTRRYYIPQKGFTFNEIRFLVDSVSINKFLSPARKRRLIHKFEVLCSEAQVRQLISRVSLSGRETPSYDLLENLEKVHAIISDRRKIQFEYGKSDLHGNLVYYQKDREMIPCKVVYFNERFYLKCVDATNGSIRTYRIDRMRRISGGESVRKLPQLPKPEGAVLDMFEPERFAVVKLRIKRILLDDLLEHLGDYARAEDDASNPGSVIVSANIGISRNFYRWVMKYGENVEILSPPDIRDEMQTMLEEILKKYKK